MCVGDKSTTFTESRDGQMACPGPQVMGMV